MELTDRSQRVRGREIIVKRRGTGMNDPWTWTMVWGLTMGAGAGGWARWKHWDNCNRNNNKKKKREGTVYLGITEGTDLVFPLGRGKEF